MSPALLLPLALGALAALLIPLAIHIARRTESRSVAFAALRWLDPLPKPRRRLRIDERRLLAVRLLLLAAIVLGLAQPVLKGLTDRRPVIAIAPGLDRQAVDDADGNARVIWLARGFPAIDRPPPPMPANIVSLIRQLDSELAPGTPLELVVPAVLDGVDAERPRLSRNATWRVAEQATPTAPRPAAPAPLRLTVRYGPDATDAVRYFRAAAIAWTAADLRADFDAAPVERPFDPEARHLVWLDKGAAPDAVVAWVRDGGTLLLSNEGRAPTEGESSVAWRDAAGQPLALQSRLGRGRVLRLTRPLEPSAMPQLAQPDFPDALARLFEPPPAPARVAAVDHAPLKGAPAYSRPPFDLRPWLALVVALLFGAERWLATRRTRGVAP